MMQLIDIHSATATATVDALELDLSFTDDAGAEQRVPYGWIAGDPHGLGPQVDAWMAAHPDFPVTPYVAPPAPIPDLAPYQFWSMLALSGHKDDLLAFIDAMPEPGRTVAKAKLDYSLTFQRKNDLVLAAQQALGLDDTAMDALWLQASAIL